MKSKQKAARPFLTLARLLVGFILLGGLITPLSSAIADSEPVLPRFVSELNPQEVFPGANRLGDPP